MSHLGKRLHALREKNGLKQNELASILHISCSSISAYERGERAPNLDIILALSEYFDVTTDYLLGKTSYSQSPSILTEKVSDGTPIGEIVIALKALSKKQQDAIVLIINNMLFYEVAKTELNETRLE